MTNLSVEMCWKLKEARRAAGISQSELAAEIGCKQSAISMFEQGNPTKLNDEAVELIAKKFGVNLKESSKPKEAPVASPIHHVAHSGYCPNANCPSNHEYGVDGRKLYLPDRVKADPVGGRYCAYCGEILEHNCPNCGAPVHDGAICSICGETYIMI